MVRRFAATVGFVLASAGFSAALGAQTGVISGIILDETNRLGLSGVQISIKGTELVGVTNRDGKVTIAGVPAGVRELEARRAGYRTFKLSVVKVAANDTARLDFALAIDPTSAVAAEEIRLAAERALVTEAQARLEARLRENATARARTVRDTVIRIPPPPDR